MSLPLPTTSPPHATAMDPKLLAAMDAPLMDLANKSGGDLRRLLYAFFSFLHRRTDFYVVVDEDDAPNMKMGFREGDAEKLLLAAFRQFPLRKMPKMSAETNKKGDAAKKTTDETSTTSGKGPTVSTSASKAESKAAKPAAATKGSSTTKKDEPNEIRLTEEGLQVPVGNGGTTKRYTWTQTIDECSVLIAVPEGTKGRDLDVTLKPSSVSVKLKQSDTILLKGELVERIRTDESTWSLEGGVLVLTLDKLKKTWWENVMKGDDKIDTTLVDARRRIGEYDDSTQAAIRKILFDQRQERLGLPTSDELLGKQSLPPGVEYIDKSTFDKHAAKDDAT